VFSFQGTLLRDCIPDVTVCNPFFVIEPPFPHSCEILVLFISCGFLPITDAPPNMFRGSDPSPPVYLCPNALHPLDVSQFYAVMSLLIALSLNPTILFTHRHNFLSLSDGLPFPLLTLLSRPLVEQVTEFSFPPTSTYQVLRTFQPNAPSIFIYRPFSSLPPKSMDKISHVTA